MAAEDADELVHFVLLVLCIKYISFACLRRHVRSYPRRVVCFSDANAVGITGTTLTSAMTAAFFQATRKFMVSSACL